MSSSNVRSVGLSVKRRINEIYSAVAPLKFAADGWDLDGEDVLLPSDLEMKAAVLAYETIELSPLRLYEEIQEIKDGEESPPISGQVVIGWDNIVSKPETFPVQTPIELAFHRIHSLADWKPFYEKIAEPGVYHFFANDEEMALKASLNHTHSYADITEKPATFSGQVVIGWDNIVSKPETFPVQTPIELAFHRIHSLADWKPFYEKIAEPGVYHFFANDEEMALKASLNHTHSYADITEKPATFPPSTFDVILSTAGAIATNDVIDMPYVIPVSSQLVGGYFYCYRPGGVSALCLDLQVYVTNTQTGMDEWISLFTDTNYAISPLFVESGGSNFLNPLLLTELNFTPLGGNQFLNNNFGQQQLRIVCLSAGTGAQGVRVMLRFQPL